MQKKNMIYHELLYHHLPRWLRNTKEHVLVESTGKNKQNFFDFSRMRHHMYKYRDSETHDSERGRGYSVRVVYTSKSCTRVIVRASNA